MNSAVFERTMENVKKNIEILNLPQRKEEEHILCENQIIILQSFWQKIRKSISHRNEKKEIPMNKLVYLGLSALKLIKILMHEYCYDYVKLKCGEKAKMCYMNTDSFIAYIKSDVIYKDIAEDLDSRFDT